MSLVGLPKKKTQEKVGRLSFQMPIVEFECYHFQARTQGGLKFIKTTLNGTWF